MIQSARPVTYKSTIKVRKFRKVPDHVLGVAINYICGQELNFRGHIVWPVYFYLIVPSSFLTIGQGRWEKSQNPMYLF